VEEAMRRHVPWSARAVDALRPGVLLGLLLALLAVASCVDRVATRNRPGAEDRRLDRKTGLVTHVADGDTLEVEFDDPGSPVRVRLLGIDAPELDSEHGEAAKRYAFARAGNQRVTIRLDQLQSTRDKYGRLLAYVYLPNHELLNNSLVRDGHAFAYRPRKCDFSTMFETSENVARSKKTGLWKTIRTEQMPAWRQHWMSERGLK
jgi:micrococcal nuclease